VVITEAGIQNKLIVMSVSSKIPVESLVNQDVELMLVNQAGSMRLQAHGTVFLNSASKPTALRIFESRHPKRFVLVIILADGDHKVPVA
jgi:hypothetical protein